MAANQSHQNAQTKQNRVVKSGTFRALTFPVSMTMFYGFTIFATLEKTEHVKKKSLKLSKLEYWCNCNLDRNHEFY